MKVKKIRRFLGLFIFTLLIINFAILQGALAQYIPEPDEEILSPTKDEVKGTGSSGQTETLYESLIFQPQVIIPFSNMSSQTPVGKYNTASGTMVSDLLPRYIKAIYDYGIAIAGILAAVVLMGGGFLWLTSIGNESRVSKAKELITGGISGLVLLFLSYLVLNAINPNLLEFRPIITQVTIKKIFDSGCCVVGGKVSFLSKESCSKAGGSYDKDGLPNYTTNKCEKLGCCSMEVNGVSGMKCFETSNYQCGRQNGLKFYDRPCDTTLCKEIGSCQGINGLGENAKSPNSTYTNNIFCYENKIFVGKGQKNEPCGTEQYAKCDENKKEGGFKCVGGTGGRDCGAGLSCCRFKENGYRLNDNK